MKAVVVPPSSRTPVRFETPVTSTLPPFMGVAVPPGKALGKEGAMLVAFQQIMANLKLTLGTTTPVIAIKYEERIYPILAISSIGSLELAR